MTKCKLSVVIHTEEEFDWSKGFKGENNHVTHGAELTQMCEEMLRLGCHITFAMDWAFVESEQGQAVIKYMQEHHSEQVEFATHLHPWVNPPFQEASDKFVSEKDSYPGNLPEDVEAQKLEALTNKIEQFTGSRPTSYLAGRYGVGPNTYNTLKSLGYRTDVSVTPFTDYRHQHGPNFSHYTNAHHVAQGITCIPHSTGYISYIPSMADWLNRDAAHLATLNKSFLGKIILKLLGVKKVRLSPEGFTSSEMAALTASLQRIGIKHLIYSFHSSTSKLGGSPYVYDDAALRNLKLENIKALTRLLMTCNITTLNTQND